MSMVTKETFIFTWEIENFDLSLLKSGEVLESPVFETCIWKETSWFLKINSDDSEKYISCYLKTKRIKQDISLKFTITLIDNDNEGLEFRSDDITTFTEKDDGWGYKEFYETDELENTTGPITIRCIMAPHKSVEENFRCKGRTKIAVDRSCFRWNVEEIESPSWKKSKIFSCSSAHIELELTAPEDFMNISIKKVDKGKTASHYVSCKLSVIDLKGIERDSKKSEYLFKSGEENDTWQFPNFLQKSKLQNEKSKYIKYGKFTIKCEFCVSDGSSVNYIEEYDNNGLVSIHSGAKVDTFTVLREDLKRMYAQQLQTDIELLTENRTFRVHKSLLSVRSPVFAAMFEQNMLEKQTGVVNIPDVEAEVLECFLEFMYTGTVDILDCELALKLLIVADKYQVSSLKNKCSSFLMLNLATANVYDVIGVANMIGNTALKYHAMDYIASHADVMFISEDWSQCIQNDIKLATDILKNLSVKSNTVCLT